LVLPLCAVSKEYEQGISLSLRQHGFPQQKGRIREDKFDTARLTILSRHKSTPSLFFHDSGSVPAKPITSGSEAGGSIRILFPVFLPGQLKNLLSQRYRLLILALLIE
jgi:hypothetical protein